MDSSHLISNQVKI